jgi:schlafen family protein
MPVELTAALMASGESHTLEFKTGFGELREAAKTVVAFANAHGGDLFFGVTNDCRVRGVDIGANTLERLAADLDRHIYPYSPAAIDPVMADGGSSLVRLSVVHDTPPVIGMYMYSSQPLDLDKEILTERLEAFRRVGRTNRRTPNFMWLRAQFSSDPLMLIDIYPWKTERAQGFPRSIQGAAWLPDGSGQAHHLRFRIEPEGLAPPADSFLSLPWPESAGTAPFAFTLDQSRPVEAIWVVVDYQDDWGCRWSAKRHLTLVKGGETYFIAGDFARHIVALPPPRGAA